MIFAACLSKQKDILMNKEVIAVNQDKLGIQGLSLLRKMVLNFGSKPLADNDWAFVF